MNENKTKKTATTGQAAENRKADNTAMASGIIRTVQHVLRDTAVNRDPLPPGSAGSLGTMLCIAMDLLPCSERGAVKTSLGDVAHILGAAFLERTPVSPTIAAALADIIQHATENGHTPCGTVDDRGRKYVATIQPPPDVAAAGITAIEIWSEAPLKPEDVNALRMNMVKSARRGVEMNEELDRLREETDSLAELVAKGALKDGKTREQVIQRLTALLGNVGKLKKDVDGLPGGAALKAEVEANKKERDARATARMKRVPDWRDTQRVSCSGVLRDATGGSDAGADSAQTQKPQDKLEAKSTAAKHATCAGPCSRGAEHKNGAACGGTAEVSTYYTPEEAENLIVRIREWFSACKREHDLSDLATTIEKIFRLSDGQLGELAGISSRLVCHVRHGRPSPFAKARFTEVFGFDGGAK